MRASETAISKIVILPLSSRVRMVADRHRLAAYHNKHCWRTYRGYQHWWPWRLEQPWTPNIRVLKVNFRYFRLRHTFQEWTAPKSLNIRLRQPAYEMKLNLSRVSWAFAHISCCIEGEKTDNIPDNNFNKFKHKHSATYDVFLLNEYYTVFCSFGLGCIILYGIVLR